MSQAAENNRYIERYLVIYHFAFHENAAFQLDFYSANPSDEEIETAIEKRLKKIAESDHGLEQYEVYTDLVFQLKLDNGGVPIASFMEIYVSIDQQPQPAIIEDES